MIPCSPKKNNSCCQISAEMFPPNLQLCFTVVLSWYPLYPFVSTDYCEFCQKSMLSSPILSTGLYWRIHMIEMMPALVWFIIVTLGSTYLIAFAYKNTKFILKHKVCLYHYSYKVWNINCIMVFRLQSKGKKLWPEKLPETLLMTRKLARKKKMKSINLLYYFKVSVNLCYFYPVDSLEII